MKQEPDLQNNQNLTYLEIWELRRKAGFLAVTLRTSMYAFVLLIFIRVCYGFYIRSLVIGTKDVLILILPAFLIGTIIWFANETAYKMKKKKK